MNIRKTAKVETKHVGSAHSSLNVSQGDYWHLSMSLPSPTLSTSTLTPSRVRPIDQDMEALRLSRQDNPFIQQVIASRESLIDTLDEESDHANLMSKDMTIDLGVDPLTLPEMHEYMVRSPPPMMWPKSTNIGVFQFPNGAEEMFQLELNTVEKEKGYFQLHSQASESEVESLPVKSQPKSHHCIHPERFSLLASNHIRSSAEDNIHLMSED